MKHNLPLRLQTSSIAHPLHMKQKSEETANYSKLQWISDRIYKFIRFDGLVDNRLIPDALPKFQG